MLRHRSGQPTQTVAHGGFTERGGTDQSQLEAAATVHDPVGRIGALGAGHFHEEANDGAERNRKVRIVLRHPGQTCALKERPGIPPVFRDPPAYRGDGRRTDKRNGRQILDSFGKRSFIVVTQVKCGKAA